MVVKIPQNTLILDQRPENHSTLTRHNCFRRVGFRLLTNSFSTNPTTLHKLLQPETQKSSLKPISLPCYTPQHPIHILLNFPKYFLKCVLFSQLEIRGRQTMPSGFVNEMLLCHVLHSFIYCLQLLSCYKSKNLSGSNRSFFSGKLGRHLIQDIEVILFYLENCNSLSVVQLHSPIVHFSKIFTFSLPTMPLRDIWNAFSSWLL